MTDEFRDAVFSECQLYRFELRRQWDAGLPWLLVIGLNPSTADAVDDDPTMRRVRGFAKRDGFGGFIMCNTFPLIETDSAKAVRVRIPQAVLATNAHHIALAADESRRTLVCWGPKAPPCRVTEVREVLRDRAAQALCLGLTKGGHPKHPLYLRSDTPMVRWS